MIKLFHNPMPVSVNWAALLLRLVFCGVMFLSHGQMKLALFSESPDSFSNPLGLGSTTSYYLVIFAEIFCSLLVLLGFYTRLALVPLVFTMLVAIFVVHWENPFGEKELSILYLAVFGCIWLLGPGKYSLDHLLLAKKNKL